MELLQFTLCMMVVWQSIAVQWEMKAANNFFPPAVPVTCLQEM